VTTVLKILLDRQKLSLSNAKSDTGTSMVEIVMVLLIMSILAVAAFPKLQKQAIRSKEYQLRRDLIAVRTSIDKFHKDWSLGLIVQNSSGVSINGFPASWEALIDGVQDAHAGGKRRYLRAIPQNPFASDDAEQWRLLGYRDPKDSQTWDGVDIYDIHAQTTRVGLDGTNINEW
jgi:general secretion pathway protein G